MFMRVCVCVCVCEYVCVCLCVCVCAQDFGLPGLVDILNAQVYVCVYIDICLNQSVHDSDH